MLLGVDGPFIGVFGAEKYAEFKLEGPFDATLVERLLDDELAAETLTLPDTPEDKTLESEESLTEFGVGVFGDDES